MGSGGDEPLLRVSTYKRFGDYQSVTNKLTLAWKHANRNEDDIRDLTLFFEKNFPFAEHITQKWLLI